TWLAIALAGLYVGSFCWVYAFAPQVFLRPYGLADQPQVRELVTYVLRFVAAYSVFDAMAVVFNSAIRGAGDTGFAMLFSFSMGVVLLVVPTYLASSHGGDGFIVAWYAVTVYVTVLGLGFMARFVQGRWQSMRVIEHTLSEVDAVAAEEENAPSPVLEI